MSNDGMTVGVLCGRCGSDDIYMVACPEHEWAVGSVCFACLHATRIDYPEKLGIEAGSCPECGKAPEFPERAT